MSLYSDVQYDGYFEELYPFGMAGDVWHSHSGDIRVSGMTDSHIRACMRIVGEDDDWYGRFQVELKRREALKDGSTTD